MSNAQFQRQISREQFEEMRPMLSHVRELVLAQLGGFGFAEVPAVPGVLAHDLGYDPDPQQQTVQEVTLWRDGIWPATVWRVMFSKAAYGFVWAQEDGEWEFASVPGDGEAVLAFGDAEALRADLLMLALTGGVLVPPMAQDDSGW